jgi:hypothetical protein
MQYTNNLFPIFPVHWVDRPAENVYEEANESTKAKEGERKIQRNFFGHCGVRTVHSILSVLSDRGFGLLCTISNECFSFRF